jgi:dTMP kinase
MFITIEGIDKSGKSTVINRLKEDYTNIYFTKEPTETDIGKTVRNFIGKNNVSEMTTFFLFMADHSEHVERLDSAISSNKAVICDRYIDSRYAYQAHSLRDHVENPLEWIKNIQNKEWTIKPDLTIYLDITPEESLERIDKDENLDRFEKLEFQSQVRSNYKTLLREFDDRIIEVDASKPKDDVYYSVRNLIESKI